MKKEDLKRVKLLKGNNIDLLKTLPENSIDSIVTDGPYGLVFMNKKWDYDVPSVQFWKEAYRVLKPGGHILSFGGTRTYHRMVVNIEDAGFEIRDQIMWLYGSGFPKSLNIGKAVDKIEGNDREVVGKLENYQDKRGLNGQTENVMENAKPRIDIDITKGNSDWEGWGTALKPANEPICLARKPLSEKTIADNVLKWKTGGLNIDGCRIGTETISSGKSKVVGGGQLNLKNTRVDIEETFHEGRFPANIILECICDELLEGKEIKGNENYKWNNVDSSSDIFKSRGKYTPRTETPDIHTNPMCPCFILDSQSGISKSTPMKESIRKENILNKETNSKKDIYAAGSPKSGSNHNDKGGASRFFYQAKVSKKERNLGCDGLEDKVIEGRDAGQDERSVAFKKRPTPTKNTHPTVKPVDLMAYLCRLITPPNGIVLDPFMGSGSTGIAAQLEGFRFCGMEMDEDYFKIAETRIENWEKYKK